MPFRYYLTFIDETEVGSDGGSSQIRAKSLPPLTVSQQEEEQDVLQQLVAALPERAAHLQPLAPQAPQVVNEGSRGHPDICRRPCIRMARGNCEAGRACGFCHLPHTAPKIYLNKPLREYLGSLTDSERLAVLLPHFQERLPHVAAQELLEVMHQEANANGPAGGKRGQLDQQLRRMNMAGLFGFLRANHFKGTSRIPAIAMEVLETLRVEEPTGA
ncbi:unnamed protein product [Effrenium voratum]|uniref:C3H1-type domain-containing protein n=1 Tax=Effrenium voratum TaxID=2562239 RepID=A0AA36I1R5_9DINO|nr:unnamed protein product [Effrenium voratum]